MKKWIAALSIPVISGLIILFVTRALQPPEEEKSPKPVIVTFEANPETIDPGQESILRWKTENATEVTLNGELVALSGSEHVKLQERTLYKLIATNDGMQSVSETIVVDVDSPLPPNIVNFVANPDSIDLGERSTLYWKTKGAVKVLLEGKPVPLSGNKLVKPQKDHRYTIVAINEKEDRVEAFTTVRVTTPLPPPKITEFKAYPASIIKGRKSTLHWRTKDASQIMLDGNLVTWEGNRDVNPLTTTTYILTAKNEEGEKVIKSAKVEVKLSKLPKILEFSANPLIIKKRKEYSTLSWKTEDATEVILNDKVVALSDEKKVYPKRTTVYQLIAKNMEGKRATATTEVEVDIPGPPQIIFFSAEPSSIYPGETSKLSWAAVDATRVSLEGEEVLSSGNKTVRLAGTTKYTLVAISEGGKDIEKITIKVDKPPKIISFYAKPDDIWKGDPSGLFWKTENATEVRINDELVSHSCSKMVRPYRTTTYTLIVRDRTGGVKDQKNINVDVNERPGRNQALLYSLTPRTILDNNNVKQSIVKVLESGDRKGAKMLLMKAGYPNGLSFDLSLSKFESTGWSMKEAQIMAAKLSAVSIRVRIIRD